MTSGSEPTTIIATAWERWRARRERLARRRAIGGVRVTRSRGAVNRNRRDFQPRQRCSAPAEHEVQNPFAEVDDDRRDRADLDEHREHLPERVVLQVDAKQSLAQHQVPRRAHRQEFRHAFDDAQHDRHQQVEHRRNAFPRLAATPLAPARRAGTGRSRDECT
jgi:hypothetical protein